MSPEEKKLYWYPRLVEWRYWEFPVPGREAVAGFFIVLIASLALHLFVLWMCSWFKTQ